MGKQTIGRDQVHDAAWNRDSYPPVLISCMLPVIVLLMVFVLAGFGLSIWQKSLPASVNIPPIKGLPLASAERRLEKIGLQVEVVKERQPSEKIAAGAVIASSPPEGKIVKAGRAVRLLISAGSQYTRVPDVANLPQSEAREILAKATLQIVSEDSRYDESVPVDYVIAISPKPGAKVAKFSSVKLQLSKGSRSDFDASAMEGNLRSTEVVCTVPMDATNLGEIRIEVTDDNGTRTVYQQSHEPGDTVVQTVEGEGKTTVKVFFGTRLIMTKKL